MGRARARTLGVSYRWLWGSYAVSAYGSALGFGAFPLIAIVVLHATPVQVSLLAAVGLAASAVLSLPLGAWVDRRHKRPVMIGMDLLRCCALLSVPAAFTLGRLSFAQLVLVSILTATAKIVFNAASGAHLRDLVPPGDLLVATSRFESTNWSAMFVGPPLGGAAIGALGPVTTVTADAASYLLSALGIVAIPGPERCADTSGTRIRTTDLVAGWRHIVGHAELRPLLLNAVLVNGLILATEPVIAVLLLGQLRFAPWQYGLAFATPCLGGLAASRLAQPLAARYGPTRLLHASGALRACWLLPLAVIPPGTPGLVLVVVVELGLIASCGLFNPLLAARRFELTPNALTARTLSAWAIVSSASIAVLTATWGLLAEAVGPRRAIAVAGALMLLTPLLLPRRGRPSGGPDAGTTADASATPGPPTPRRS